MSNYKEIKGDLLELAKAGKFDVIVHGANCFNTMGAGIAASIKRKFPSAYHMDSIDKRPPIQKLGDFSWALEPLSTGRNFTIINLYSQFLPGKNLDLEALTLGLRKLNVLYKGKHIGLPQIGCGIAGGDWNVVSEIIKKELSEVNVTIVIFEK